MGKCNVVIDFGNGKTKISAFEKEGNKFVLTTGAIIETGENNMESPELLQSISSFLLQMRPGAGNLILIMPENGDIVPTTVAEYPLGTNKEVDGMIKNNLSAIIPENQDKYHCSWRHVRNTEEGLGEFQIAAVKKQTMENIQDIAAQHKLNLVSADLAANAVENLAVLLQKNEKLAPKSANDAMAIVEVGYKSVRVCVFTRDAIIKTKSIGHDLYRMDKLIYDSLGDLKQDKNIVPEFLKMNASFALKVKQYQNFLQSVTSDIIMQIKRSIGGETSYRLSNIYFTGGMYKMPHLVSTVKDSFGVPCYAFPIEDYIEINHGCILRENNKPYPSEEVYTASIGALYGGV